MLKLSATFSERVGEAREVERVAQRVRAGRARRDRRLVEDGETQQHLSILARAEGDLRVSYAVWRQR